MRHHPRAANLEDQFLAQLFLLALEGILELEQAPLPERTIGRPTRLVEGPPRRVDGTVDIRGRSVGDFADHSLRRGIGVDEGSRRTLNQRAVDEHPRFVFEFDRPW